MTLRLRGVIHTTGSKGSGKTTLNLQVANLKDIALFHSDVKYPGVDPKEFGLFIDLQKLADGKKLFELREAVLAELGKIKIGQYQAIIFDTWTRIGEAFRNWVVAHPNEMREKDAFVMRHNAQVIGSQTWRDAYEYEAHIIWKIHSLTNNGFLGLITHTKEESQANAKTGRDIPDASKTLYQVANWQVWLIRNGRGLPTVVSMKPLGEAKAVDGRYKMVNILPDRFDCQPEDESVWDAVDRYRQNPFGNRAPRPDEIPSEFELSIIRGTMTKEQKEIWKANLAAQVKEESLEVEPLTEEMLQLIQKMKAEDESSLKIVKALNSTFNSRVFTLDDLKGI